MIKIDRQKWVAVEVSQVTSFQIGISSSPLRVAGGALVLSNICDPQRIIAISVGSFEAKVISSKLTENEFVCPMTYSSLYKVIQKLRAKVNAVFITWCRQDMYYAKILLQQDNRRIEFNIRASEAIVLAVSADVPIFVAKHLMKKIQDVRADWGILGELFLRESEDQALGSEFLNPETEIDILEREMCNAARIEDYETAAHIRDRLNVLKQQKGVSS